VSTIAQNMIDDIDESEPWPDVPAPTHAERTTYRAIVADVATRAKERLPESINGRLESAVKLVLQHDVRWLEDGAIEVGSSSDPMKTYTLAGHACDCQDFAYGQAPEGWCQHRIAAGIAKRVGEVMAQQARDAGMTAVDAHEEPMVDVRPATYDAATPPPAPGALGEAPASCNVYVMISGHKVQVTLRDSDEARMLDRLQVLLARYPAAPAREERRDAPPAQTDEVPQCYIHGAMKESTKAPGTYYCPKKLANGEYCKERHPKA